MERGMETEYEDVFRATRGRLYSFLQKLLHDPSLAEDCMQQCYMKLWEVFGEIDRNRDLLPLLYVYARNAAIDTFRKNRKYIHLADLVKKMDEFRVAAGSNHYAEDREQMKLLEEKVNRMPLRRREVFRLIRLEGCSYREAAAMLNISVSTVEKHITAAGRTLMEAQTSH